uniref:Splicing factor Cactin n=1 Tax=Zonotrichia albicollis TaxID=44394 RepID=A0A8D2M1N2_ZONAL
MTSCETTQNKHRQEPANGAGPKQQGPRAELLLPMSSRLCSPARGRHPEQERDLDKEQNHEQDQGLLQSGSCGQLFHSQSKSWSWGQHWEPSLGSDSGNERQKWKKKKRSCSQDQHHKDQRKQCSWSQGCPSCSSLEHRQDRAAQSQEWHHRRDGSKYSVSSISSPGPLCPQEELGQQLSPREEEKKQAALLKALETPKEKRAQRLAKKEEKAMQEQELEMLQQEKEAEHFKTWEEQEDNLHLQQAKLWSKIWIQDGRVKPTDLLAKYISAEDDDLAVEMHEPYTFLNGLTISDMEELVYTWRTPRCTWSWRGPGECRDGINASVSSDVQAVLKGKTYNQLQALYQGIERAAPGHATPLPIIKQEPASLSNRLDPEESLEAQPGPSSEPEQDTEAKGEAEAVLMEEDLYSPWPPGPNKLPCNAHMLEAEEDMHQQLQVIGNASENTHNIIFHKAKEGMGTDKAQFSTEMPLTGQAYLWADKYQPHKPRLFNHVHTDFEWNKYNQTHYDTDNPPPKTVQGYKFNIFYPDLIDKHSAPEYFLEACQDSKDFAILRFRARPPYEGIAFKIFANGIFQLWLHFRQYRYHW